MIAEWKQAYLDYLMTAYMDHLRMTHCVVNFRIRKVRENA